MRNGFQRLELIAVVFVVVVLTAVALPAMQAARQQARVISCTNNMKQLGLAIHNYHDTYNTIPPGWISQTNLPNSNAGFGWMTMILPFMEEAKLYDQLDKNLRQCDLPTIEAKKEYAENSIEKSLQSNIANYQCPFDRTSPVNPMRGYYGLSNYSGSYGSTAISPLAAADTSVTWPGQASFESKGPNGMFHMNSRVRFADITDGLSNTFMVGERAVQNGAGIWPGVRSNAHANDTVTDCSYNNEYNTTLGSFSSQHVGGMNVLFGDGHVSFMSENIESKPDTLMGAVMGPQGIYQKLASRNDGQPVSTDNFFDKPQ